MNNRDIYVIENKSIMDNFNIVTIKLQEIITTLPRKKGAEEGIFSDILKAAYQ
jgi:hypothetical protein